MMSFGQEVYRVRFEWGMDGLIALKTSVAAIVIVDVLSFSTCVDIAVSNGATIFPHGERGERAIEYATRNNAIAADHERNSTGFTLSPASLANIPSGTRLVLPSPNGSRLSFEHHGVPIFTACLRNANAVAEYLNKCVGSIGVIAAGEQWPNGSLRPALEDHIGAGALIAMLSGTRSPEAEAGVAVFESVQSHLKSTLDSCGSGRELIDRGFAYDVALAAELNVSNAVPMLDRNAYQDAAIVRSSQQVQASEIVNDR